MTDKIKKFRVVTSDDTEVVENAVHSIDERFAAAARQAMEKVLDDNAMAITIIYETPEQIFHLSIPGLDCVSRGLITDAYDSLNEFDFSE